MTDYGRLAAEHIAQIGQALLDSPSLGIVVDIGYDIVYANEALARMLEYPTPHDLIGRPTVELAAPEDRGRTTQYREARLRGEYAPDQYQVTLQKRDGTRHLSLCIPVALHRNGLGGMTVAFLDAPLDEPIKSVLSTNGERRTWIAHLSMWLVVIGWILLLTNRVSHIEGTRCTTTDCRTLSNHLTRQEALLEGFAKRVDRQDKQLDVLLALPTRGAPP